MGYVFNVTKVRFHKISFSRRSQILFCGRGQGQEYHDKSTTPPIRRLFFFSPMNTLCMLAGAASAFHQGGRLPPPLSSSFRSVARRSSHNNHTPSSRSPSLLFLNPQSPRQSTSTNINANMPSFSALLSSPSESTPTPQLKFQQLQLETLQRILLPSLLASLASTLLFPPLALSLSYLINDAATFAVLSVDSSQFVQNFLTVTGLTFSILVGQTYYFMYQQQESVFNSLFGEVTEAKSLLEQVALVCQGREEMYRVCLGAIHR